MNTWFIVWIAGVVVSTAGNEITIDHMEESRADRGYQEVRLQVEEGESIEFRIANTCEEEFDYQFPRIAQVDRIDADSESSGDDKGRSGSPPPTESASCSESLDINRLENDLLTELQEAKGRPVHSCRLSTTRATMNHIGGYDYQVNITRRPDVSDEERRTFSFVKAEDVEEVIESLLDDEESCQSLLAQMNNENDEGSLGDILSSELLEELTVHTLMPLSVRVLTPQSERGWEPAFSGGLVGSTIVDRRYGIQDDGGGAVIRRTPGREDEISTGAVAFVHARYTPPSRPSWYHNIAPSLGVGLRGSSPDIYLGVSYRFGEVAYLSLGLASGDAEILPAGERVGEAPSGPNALSNMPTSREMGGFISLSFELFGEGSQQALSNLIMPSEDSDE